MCTAGGRGDASWRQLILGLLAVHDSAAGAPAPTRNIFCDPVADTCFNLTVSVKSFDAASAACAAMTGRLVTYTSAAKQLMVEQVRARAHTQIRARPCPHPTQTACLGLASTQHQPPVLLAVHPALHTQCWERQCAPTHPLFRVPRAAQYFKSKSTLPSTGYWHGVVANTSDASGGFMLADNSSVPQNYSVTPYAHWAWNYNTKRSAGGYSCVVARGSQAYDYFIGESSQLGLKAYYSSTSDNKFGWDLEVRGPMQPRPASKIARMVGWQSMVHLSSHCNNKRGPCAARAAGVRWRCVRLHLRGARLLVPLLPAAVAQPAAALAARCAAATGSTRLP